MEGRKKNEKSSIGSPSSRNERSHPIPSFGGDRVMGFEIASQNDFSAARRRNVERWRHNGASTAAGGRGSSHPNRKRSRLSLPPPPPPPFSRDRSSSSASDRPDYNRDAIPDRRGAGRSDRNAMFSFPLDQPKSTKNTFSSPPPMESPNSESSTFSSSTSTSSERQKGRGRGGRNRNRRNASLSSPSRISYFSSFPSSPRTDKSSILGRTYNKPQSPTGKSPKRQHSKQPSKKPTNQNLFHALAHPSTHQTSGEHILFSDQEIHSQPRKKGRSQLTPTPTPLEANSNNHDANETKLATPIVAASTQRWRTHQIAEDYITLAGEMIYPPTKIGSFGYDHIHRGEYPVESIHALALLKHPARRPSVVEKWSPYEIALFEASLSVHGKDFHRVQKDVNTKTTKELVEFYYIWKKTSHYKVWKQRFRPMLWVEDMNDDEHENGTGGG